MAGLVAVVAHCLKLKILCVGRLVSANADKPGPKQKLSAERGLSRPYEHNLVRTDSKSQTLHAFLTRTTPVSGTAEALLSTFTRDKRSREEPAEDWDPIRQKMIKRPRRSSPPIVVDVDQEEESVTAGRSHTPHTDTIVPSNHGSVVNEGNRLVRSAYSVARDAKGGRREVFTWIYVCKEERRKCIPESPESVKVYFSMLPFFFLSLSPRSLFFSFSSSSFYGM